ncbi:MAG: hypothetical protein ABR557_01705, partial [Pyrinomonadaceae bacterium]
ARVTGDNAKLYALEQYLAIRDSSAVLRNLIIENSVSADPGYKSSDRLDSYRSIPGVKNGKHLLHFFTTVSF